jgi:tetratricopeptide (TPR) repeat protein
MKLFDFCMGMLFLVVSLNVIGGESSARVAQLLEKAIIAANSDLDSAEELIETALEIAPNNSKVQFLCGKIMGRQAEDAFFSALSYANKSLKCLKRAVALDPKNIDYRSGLMSFYLGAPSIAGGDETLALEQAQSIYKLEPIKGISAKLKYYRSTNDSDSNLQLLKQARKEHSSYAEFHYRHGLVLQEKGEYDEATSAFIMSTKAENDDENEYQLNALYQIGRTSVFSKKNIDDGITAFEKYIEVADQRVNKNVLEWAHFRLAQLFKLSNNKQKMSEHLKVISDSNDKELQREIRRLRR